MLKQISGGGCCSEKETATLQYSCLVSPMDRGAWKAMVQWGRKESEMTEQPHVVCVCVCCCCCSVIVLSDSLRSH